MIKVIIKLVLGILLGFILFAIFKANGVFTGNEWAFFMLWGVGIIGGFREYISWLAGTLNASLRLGFLAWLSFGSGVIGFIFLVFALMFILMIGWIYGWYLLIREFLSSL